MVLDRQSRQRIARLTPLSDVLAFLDAHVSRCAGRELPLGSAQGHVLAQDVRSSRIAPGHHLALRDGWALKSDLISDASSYAPMLLPAPPVWVDAGDAMPDGADCVVPLDAVEIDGAGARSLAPAAPGEGVLLKGADADRGTLLCRAGKILRASDIAVLSALGIGNVSVVSPRIRIVAAHSSDDPVVTAAAALLAAAARADGTEILPSGGRSLEDALRAQDCDAVIAIGGTGSGSNDASVATLAHTGQVAFHGIGLMPGETAAVGMAGSRPVLLVPGRINAALACWLALGARMMRLLGGRTEPERSTAAVLSRKIASTIGIVDVVPVRLDGDTAEPLAGNYWPMHAIARANGFVMVAAQSEGHPAGARVQAICWPGMGPEAGS